jgi:hypothetical protein
MFGFGSSRKDDIFEIDDIRELVLAFPNQAELRDQNSPREDIGPEELIPLASDQGFIQFGALYTELQRLFNDSMIIEAQACDH